MADVVAAAPLRISLIRMEILRAMATRGAPLILGPHKWFIRDWGQHVFRVDVEWLLDKGLVIEVDVREPGRRVLTLSDDARKIALADVLDASTPIAAPPPAAPAPSPAPSTPIGRAVSDVAAALMGPAAVLSMATRLDRADAAHQKALDDIALEASRLRALVATERAFLARARRGESRA